MKDPAFLFYTKDFYEGTRMMLPEERACYIDLLCYQHQNGVIPDDLKRLQMYCSGIDEATLKATLEAKFKLSSKGWVNNRLQETISERESFRNKQAINGTVGQFWKKAKRAMSAKKYKVFREYIYNLHTNESLFEELKKHKGSHEAMLKAMLKQANANAIEDGNEDKKEKEPELLFCDTDLMDFDIFEKELPKAKESGVNLLFYHEAVKDWKPDKMKRTRRGWIATARTFMRNDMQNGKLQTIKKQTGQIDIFNDEGALKERFQ